MGNAARAAKKSTAKPAADKNVRSVSPTDAIIGQRMSTAHPAEDHPSRTRRCCRDIVPAGAEVREGNKPGWGQSANPDRRSPRMPGRPLLRRTNWNRKPRSEHATAFAEYVASREGVLIIEALIAIESAHVRHQIISLVRKTGGSVHVAGTRCACDLGSGLNIAATSDRIQSQDQRFAKRA